MLPHQKQCITGQSSCHWPYYII